MNGRMRSRKFYFSLIVKGYSSGGLWTNPTISIFFQVLEKNALYVGVLPGNARRDDGG